MSPNHIWEWFLQLHIADKLTITTNLIILSALIGEIVSFIKLRNRFRNKYDRNDYQEEKLKIISRVLAALILSLVLTTTYYEFFYSNVSLQIKSPPDKLWNLITSSTLIFIILFFKLLVCFLCLMIVTNIANLRRVHEIGAKFLGFEYQQKFNSETSELIKEANTQMTFAGEINKRSIDLLGTKFERNILNSEDVEGEIRNKFLATLAKVYFNSDVQYYALSITEEGLDVLKPNPKLYNIAYEMLSSEEVVFRPHKQFGMAKINDTLIIIDTREEGYEITNAEIGSAAVLFTSLSAIIYWASQSPNIHNNVFWEE